MTAADSSHAFTEAWYRDVLSRVGRQVVQVITPVLGAMAAGSAGGYSATGVLLAAATAALFTVLKAALSMSSDPWDPWYVQMLERAISAAAGALLGYFVAGPATDLLTLPWHAILYAVLGAAGLSVVAFFTNPPHPVVAGEITYSDDTGGSGPQD